MLTVGSLFAGIGGFDLGLERAGMRSVWQCEIDPYCQRVLAKHWPDVLRVPDIRDVRADTVPAVDVLCGGFPCQDISLAGAGAGIMGERSGLWAEYARIIRELRPRYVLVENVAALLARGLDVVLRDLAEVGMAAEWGCIRASDVGAPHRRDRLWLVAYPDSAGREARGSDRVGAREAGEPGQPARSGGALGDAESDGRRPGRQGRPLAAGEGQREPERALQDVADPDQIGWEWRPRVFGPGWWRELEDSGWWSAESGVRGVADRLSSGLDGGRVDAGTQPPPLSGPVANRNARLRALGNSLVPQIAEWIGRRIVAYEAERLRMAA